MITNLWTIGDVTLAKPVRERVFVQEQGIAAELEFDLEDSMAMHLVLLEDELPIAAGRIVHDGKTFVLGRICVLPEKRGSGVGDLLMKLLLVKVFSFMPTKVRISAQADKQIFYERYGFIAQGQPYLDETGISHIDMFVTTQTLVFASGCGKQMRYDDLVESGLIHTIEQKQDES